MERLLVSWTSWTGGGLGARLRSLAAHLAARLVRAVRQLHLRALLLGCTAFLIVGLAVSAGYRAMHGLPYISVMSEKLALLESAEIDRYSILFLGSSQTFHHIDPAVVEAELARCDRPGEVVNLGVPALRGPELRYLAARIIERRPARLQLVVMQDAIPAEGELANALSDRGRYFRGWEQIGEAAADVDCYTGSGLGRAKRAAVGTAGMLAEQLGTSRLSQLLLPSRKIPKDHYSGGKYQAHDGYWPITPEDFDPARHPAGNWFTTQRAAFAAEATAFAAAVEQGGPVPQPGAAACRAAYLDDTLKGLRAAGYATAYYVSPSPHWIRHDNAIAKAIAEDKDLTVLNYNRPKQYPGLFDGALWFDRTHLLAPGAERLSHAVGRDLCALLNR